MRKPKEQKVFISVGDASIKYDLPRQYIYILIRNNKIEGKEDEKSGVYKVSEASVEKFIKTYKRRNTNKNKLYKERTKKAQPEVVAEVQKNDAPIVFVSSIVAGVFGALIGYLITQYFIK
jgi:hypothetical protein